MATEQDYVQRIKEVYPQFTITSAVRNRIGQNNDVIIVNNEWIFRFPKYGDGIDQLERETALLHAIKPYMSLTIPEPRFQQFHHKSVGYVFSGYPLLAGETLTRELFLEVQRDRDVRILAEQLGTFLRQLHHFPVPDSLQEHFDACADMHVILSQLYQDIQEKLFVYMQREARQKISHCFEAYLSDASHFQFQACLVHGDFGGTNILYDKNHHKIAAILDFGNSGLGDPAYDFAGLISSYGEDFLELFSPVYPDLSQVIERSRFYRSTFALQEALFGLEHADPQAFQAGIAPYR